MSAKLKGLIITGFMGTGKTSVARILSSNLGMDFVDLDEEIEKEAGMKVKDIFGKMGEEGFRKMENKTLRRVLKVPGKVVSAGGGTITDPDNLKLMKSYGMVICLWAEPEEVLKRIDLNLDRPLLQGNDKLDTIKQLMEERKNSYLLADKAIPTDGRDIEEIAEEIASIWREKVAG